MSDDQQPARMGRAYSDVAVFVHGMVRVGDGSAEVVAKNSGCFFESNLSACGNSEPPCSNPTQTPSIQCNRLTEKHWLASRVFDTAGAWLGDSAGENQPFYLHIESFPHEFWDPPEDYYRAYMKKKDPMRPSVYYQEGQTMVVVETRQWKMAYGRLEKTQYDLSGESAMILEVPDGHGVHLAPWHMVLRITVTVPPQ